MASAVVAVTPAASVSVVIPWALAPGRAHGLQLVLGFYAHEFPGWELIVADDRSPTYASGRAANAGALAASGEILVRNDGDSLVPAAQVARAVSLARAEPGVVKAYRRYRRLSGVASRACSSYRDVLEADGSAIEWEMFEAQSHGVMAVRRECFLEVGGYDPRFQGWGYDDIAFDVAAGRWSSRRVDGDLFHIWHPPDPATDADDPDHAANLALFDRYSRATDELEVLAAIRAEAAPLA